MTRPMCSWVLGIFSACISWLMTECLTKLRTSPVVPAVEVLVRNSVTKLPWSLLLVSRLSAVWASCLFTLLSLGVMSLGMVSVGLNGSCTVVVNSDLPEP